MFILFSRFLWANTYLCNDPSKHRVFINKTTFLSRWSGETQETCSPTNVTGFNAFLKTKKINYPNFPQLQDLFHTQIISLSIHLQHIKFSFLQHLNNCLQRKILPSDSFEDNVTVYSRACRSAPHWVTQELLASWLNIVMEDVRIASFKTRNKDFAPLFDMENRLCYCTNVCTDVWIRCACTIRINSPALLFFSHIGLTIWSTF